VRPVSNATASPALVLCFDGPRREDVRFLSSSFMLPPSLLSRASEKASTRHYAREFIRDHNDPGNSVTVTCASFPSSADFRGWKRRSLLRARRYRSHSLPLSLSLSLLVSGSLRRNGNSARGSLPSFLPSPRSPLSRSLLSIRIGRVRSFT